MILEEFDETKNSTFDPDEVSNVIPGFPKIAVTCFSSKLFEELLNAYKNEELGRVKNANGDNIIYKLNYKGTDIAFFMSRVGAPGCIADMEEIIVMGAEKFVVFGTCGVLDSRINDLAIIIPTSSIRDEGTSYHYAKASNEIEVNTPTDTLELFKDILKKHTYSYVEGKNWTTDAIYRETRNKVMKRKEDGCISVDMECSSIKALMDFREKEVFQFFYAADNLDSQVWDKRSLGCESRVPEKALIGVLAFEMAVEMSNRYDKD